MAFNAALRGFCQTGYFEPVTHAGIAYSMGYGFTIFLVAATYTGARAVGWAELLCTEKWAVAPDFDAAPHRGSPKRPQPTSRPSSSTRISRNRRVGTAALGRRRLGPAHPRLPCDSPRDAACAAPTPPAVRAPSAAGDQQRGRLRGEEHPSVHSEQEYAPAMGQLRPSPTCK